MQPSHLVLPIVVVAYQENRFNLYLCILNTEA
jgi:hypothetical protein